MEDFGFFEYTCECWDNENKKMETVSGVVYANNFTDAIHKLEHYYDMIENVSLVSTDATDVYEFNKGTVGFVLKVNEKGEIEGN